MSTTPAEEAVRRRDELAREYDKIDGYRRDLRLGRKVGLEPPPRRLSWLAGVYGFGWAESKPEPMPAGMEREFYAFLTQKMGDVGRQLREANAGLAAFEVTR